jgi:methylmalonyl-CoA mutase
MNYNFTERKLNMEKEKNTTLPAVSFDEFKVPTYEEWKEAAIAALKGAPFDKKMYTKTYEGITLQPIYTLADVENNAQAQTMPGAGEFVRGTKAGGYITNPWLIAQGIDVADPAEFNKLAKFELEKGATAVTAVLDKATKQGVAYDAAAEGRGLSIQDAADVKAAFEGIDAPLQIAAGASALPLLNLFKEAGIQPTGVVGADPVGALLADGSLPCSIEELLDEMAETVKTAPAGLKVINIDGTVYGNGGASAVQETAYAIATAAYYIKALAERGIAVDAAAQNIRFSFAIGSNFFMEISRLRAAKAVWAQVVKELGGNEESQKIDIFARTSTFTKTVYDPYVNLLRTTTETFSAVVGGVDALQVAPFDETIGEADTQSLRYARNQQLLFKEEFNMTATVDPAGGSYYVETLTAQVIEAVKALYDQVAAEGIVEAVKAGKVQAAVEEVLQERFKNLQVRKDVAVGNNMYANTIEEPLVKDAAAEKAAKEARAQAAAGKTALADARKALNKGEAVTATAIAAHRWVEQFEALRKATEKAAAEGKKVNVFLTNYGPIPKHKARADFSRGFFEVANFNVIGNDGFPTAEEAAKAAIESGADVAVICGTDDVYPEIVPVIAKAIKAAKPSVKVMVAGAPGENKEAFDAAGVDGYVHVGANCYQILKAIQEERGIC